MAGLGKGAQIASQGLLDLVQGLMKHGMSEKDAIDAVKSGNLLGIEHAGKEPVNTQQAYKMFRQGDDGQLYPLFVDANTPVPQGEWQYAIEGDRSKSGKVKSKLGDLAYRAGWHAGDSPMSTHIGGIAEKNRVGKDKKKPQYRKPDQVWAPVEMADDFDWQSVANDRAELTKAGKPILRTKHITDQIPYGGNYRYKTNSNMTGEWLIGGQMKVGDVLSRAEVEAINSAKGVADLPMLDEVIKANNLKKADLTDSALEDLRKYYPQLLANMKSMMMPVAGAGLLGQMADDKEGMY